MVETFWRGRRVLVTGHTGFKGGWLALWLQKLGAEVTGYALPPNTTPNLFDVARVASGMHSIIGDVGDFAFLQRTMTAARAEVVLHLAAQPLVRAGYDDPLATYMTNVMGTVHVLEAVRQTHGVRAALVVTTDKCYENRESTRGYREDDRIGGYDPYSSSKACAEVATAAYRSSYFNPATHAAHGVAVATARAGNVIGGGDWSRDRLVPDILRAIEAGRPVAVRHPNAVRPWQHVLDPLHGYLLLAEKLFTEGAAFAQAWNFGPADEDARPVAWVIEELIRRWQHKPGWKQDGAPAPHETQRLLLDSSKARAHLGWRPRVALDQALEWIARWHQQHRQGADMHAFCEAQLGAFVEEAVA